MKIKGHTEIQLTNVKTGEVKTFHDDNMMTNGLAEFFKNHGMLCNTPFINDVKNDLINTLLGGILLFDTALTENANNTRLTDGVKMVANACHGVTHTGDPTELGSYDANESGWQNAAHTVYRHVFTWTTSQGNGTIASVCLTSKPHGYVGEGNSTSKQRISTSAYNNTTYSSGQSQGNSKLPFLILDNEIYYITLDGTDSSITISKAHLCDTECDMRDVATLSSTLTEEELLVINNPTQTSMTELRYVCARVLSNSVVISTKLSNSRILVLTFDKTFTQLSSYVEVTTTATSLTSFTTLCTLTADAAYLVVKAGDGKIYKIQLSNLANVTEIPNHATWTAEMVEQYCTGKRHTFPGFIYDETLDAIYPINVQNDTAIGSVNGIYREDNTAYVTATPYAGHPNDVSGGRRNDYLATINNLSSAVTKDSTQTMKVIYTLTFTA